MNIYKTTNLINGLIYIGKELNGTNPKYLGSGTLFNQVLLDYGLMHFRKDIIEYCNSKQELKERENYWINFYDSTNPEIGYNIQGGITEQDKIIHFDTLPVIFYNKDLDLLNWLRYSGKFKFFSDSMKKFIRIWKDTETIGNPFNYSMFLNDEKLKEICNKIFAVEPDFLSLESEEKPKPKPKPKYSVLDNTDIDWDEVFS